MVKRAPIPQAVRWKVFAKNFFCCQYCGRPAGDVVLHVDHIVAVANGGTNDEDNLTAACDDCNSSKGAKHLPTKPPLKNSERIDALGKVLAMRDEYPQTAGLMIDHALGQCARLAGKGIDPVVAANAIGTAALTVAILSLGFGLDGRLNKRAFMKLCSTMFDENGGQ